MKLYKHKPEKIIRITVVKKHEKPMHINVCDVSILDAITYVKNLIQAQNLSPIREGIVTSVRFRDCIGGKNGKTYSFSFSGLNVKQTHDLILNSLEK